MSAQQLRELERFRGGEPRASYSSIGLHRKCPQAWYYRYGLGIRREETTPTPYLTLGSWWGMLLSAESLERGRTAGSLVFMPWSLDAEGTIFDPEQVTVEDVLAASRKRWKAMTMEEREAFEDALGGTLEERLSGMFGLWDAANPDRAEREQPLGVEVFWERELPRPEGDAAWSLLADADAVPRMKLIGYIDELYWDLERKMVVIRDHKSHKDLSSANTALDDLMDSQLQLYAWGIAPRLKEEGLPQPRAVAYNRVRSVAPKTPVVTAAGGLSKSVTSYNAETYQLWASQDGRPTPEQVAEIEKERGFVAGGLQTVIDRMEPGPLWGKLGEFFASGPREGLPKFGTYSLDPKVLDNLQTPAERAKWVSATLSPVNRKMIQTHLRSAVDTALDIFQTQERARVRGEAARNLDRRGCQFCDFAELCRAQIVGGPEGEYDLESFGLTRKIER